jgi:hypothetical protein
VSSMSLSEVVPAANLKAARAQQYSDGFGCLGHLRLPSASKPLGRGRGWLARRRHDSYRLQRPGVKRPRSPTPSKQLSERGPCTAMLSAVREEAGVYSRAIISRKARFRPSLPVQLPDIFQPYPSLCRTLLGSRWRHHDAAIGLSPSHYFARAFHDLARAALPCSVVGLYHGRFNAFWQTSATYPDPRSLQTTCQRAQIFPHDALSAARPSSRVFQRLLMFSVSPRGPGGQRPEQFQWTSLARPLGTSCPPGGKHPGIKSERCVLIQTFARTTQGPTRHRHQKRTTFRARLLFSSHSHRNACALDTRLCLYL